MEHRRKTRTTQGGKKNKRLNTEEGRLKKKED